MREYIAAADLASVGDEGYVIRSLSRGRHAQFTVIAGKTEIGALYGTFAFLRLHADAEARSRTWTSPQSPRIKNRHLNNWETTRLYAGNNASGTGGLNGENGTIFNFAATGASADRNLPVILDRYIVVARALASRRDQRLRDQPRQRRQRLPDAGLHRAGGGARRRAAPVRDQDLAGDQLHRADRPAVRAGHADQPAAGSRTAPRSAAGGHRKARQLQASIPDFMGFTVKANSEGQPGPQDFGYDHGDGANGIAAAVAPLGMKVYWRTFVYNAERRQRPAQAGLPGVRAHRRRAPAGRDDGTLPGQRVPPDQERPAGLPGQGAVPPDVRPHGEHQPGARAADHAGVHRPEQDAHLPRADVGGGPEDRHLRTDADGAAGKRLVGNIVDGTAQGHSDTAIVGVANLGNADNLTGHHFSQANLFAFGRQAWDWTLDSEDIADDWARMTWSNDDRVVDTIVKMMMGSWEALVSYQTPLGVGAPVHVRATTTARTRRSGSSRTTGARSTTTRPTAPASGFDRSATGSNFVAPVLPDRCEQRYGNIETTPENLLMWFHHVPWDHRMDSGRTFWDELVYRYQMGVQYVTWMRESVGLAGALHRRPPLRGGEGQAGDPRGRRRRLAGHQRRTTGRSSAAGTSRWTTVRCRPRSWSTARRSAASTCPPRRTRSPWPPGASPRITQVRTADPDARYEIVSQADGVPGQAVVKVTKDDFFGPAREELRLQPGARHDAAEPAGQRHGAGLLRAGRSCSYNALLPAGAHSDRAGSTAVASDPAATVVVEQAASPTGQAKVTVTNGGASSVYTVDLDTAHHRQRRVRRRPSSARSGSGCDRTTAAGACPADRWSSPHRTATCRATRTRRGTWRCRTSTATGRRSRRSSSRGRSPTTTSRAASSPTPTTTTT